MVILVFRNSSNYNSLTVRSEREFFSQNILLPISLAFVGTSLRSRLTILMASNRISMMLFRRANNGAKGNAATKIVVKLNWITGEGRKGQCKNQICVCFKENKSFVIKYFMQISATMLGYCVWLPMLACNFMLAGGVVIAGPHQKSPPPIPKQLQLYL